MTIQMVTVRDGTMVIMIVMMIIIVMVVMMEN